jgi:hypothetical protein
LARREEAKEGVTEGVRDEGVRVVDAESEGDWRVAMWGWGAWRG